ncbi:ATP-binding protein [Providencia alcalifaciens]|uniref:ATP-binding protein n=1 Tax=Providencia alcalifaciens TaxID=126385 RepID=UPI0015CFE7BF|nr:ATP-binding protein [Providencia alcalifaciens]MBF0690362.1 ATP-binding protein [Providencia alcalifaciens]NYS88866.1 ATP-binding protein [Providencia alcalifaciens]
MEQFTINFIVNFKLREYMSKSHYQGDMFESANAAAELYLMNKAAANYLAKKTRFTWEALVKNGDKPRDLIIDILTSCCPVTQEQAQRVLSTLAHSLVSMMKENMIFTNVVNAKNHKRLFWAHVD